MNRHVHIVMVLVVSFCMGACATIKHGTMQSFRVDHKYGHEADVEITDRKGRIIYRGSTPFDISLRRSNSYFKSARYIISENSSAVDLARRDTISFRINMDYWKNIGYFNVIGLTVIDPALGGMWSSSDTVVFIGD